MADEDTFLTLGEAIDALRRIPAKDDQGQDRSIQFDFGYFEPRHVESWRGVYEHLAITYREPRAGETGSTVAELLATLERAVGNAYVGYKGGDYRMKRETPLWVANHGHANHTAVRGFSDYGWQVVINTGWRHDLPGW